ncbi:MAG: glycosyltransferase [Betaproteobacteria bacterium HGW-Betaproteobacteria-11]|nr:MAG: glycosyltransferase [Betaproteobacteria bacterium HGW-Betaproteobacteria-11]
MNERPTRILLLDTGNEWGGGTNSMIELLKRIDRTGFAVTCGFYKDYRRGKEGRLLSEELADIGIPLVVLPTRRQPRWAKLAKEFVRGLLFWHKPWRAAAVFAIERCWRIRPRAAVLAELLRREKFDLLYMNNQPASNLEGYLAGEQAGVPVVQHCRIEPKLNASERDAVNRIARAVICVSHGVAEKLAQQGVRRALCQVVHNGIDTHQALPAPQPGVPAGTPVIGTIGSLVRRKSIDHLLRAVARLPKDIAPQILIVGEGPEEAALRQLAGELGLAGRVTFAGFQKQPLSWLAALDVFVLTSPSEGLPRAILEAMLLAKPVVASNVTGSKEVVAHGETGYLYPYGDIDALATHLADLLHHSGQARAFGEAGRRRASADFSIEAYVAGVTKVLGEVAAR